MTHFIAIKVHYDHRSRLNQYLKYSDFPRQNEYQDYLNLREQGIGGEGFHECMNFKKIDGEPVRIYLPPRYRPQGSRLGEEFVIFSLTYQADQELPSCIIGIHAGAQILSRDGIPRRGVPQIQGVDPFDYHAEAPPELTTLINPPIAYDFRQGIYTPAYSRWVNGLRYISEENAERIVNDALGAATNSLTALGPTQRVMAEAQIRILEAVKERYFGHTTREESTTTSALLQPFFPPVPDVELGFLGEQAVYNGELRYAKEIGVSEEEVQWVSQADPYSPFDIRTVRKVGSSLKEVFLEVKSTKITDLTNVYISRNQIHFFEMHRGSSTFKFVIFDKSRKVHEIIEFSLQELRERFELVPIEFKLSPKQRDHS